MSVLINAKICDNAKECSGIAECPTGAIFWDEAICEIGCDSSKCIKCKACEGACPVGAIFVAENQEEYQRIKAEIDNDTRNKEDLFVDRFGAVPIDDAFLVDIEQLDSQISTSKSLMLIEFFSESSIQCLLKSIPIKDIISRIAGCVAYIKVEVDDNSCLKFGIDELPALLVFYEGALIRKIKGFYDTSRQEEMISEILEIVNLHKCM